MQTNLTEQAIEHLKATQAVLLLFGGPQCGVCQAIKPKLESLYSSRHPEVVLVYVDCVGSPAICAQHGVFSLPVVQFYIEGHLYLERSRSFSLVEFSDQVERIVRLWGGASNELLTAQQASTSEPHSSGS
jgi:thioredoxin-like negative regulator of GroEL